MVKPFHEWTDEEIEKTRQTKLEAARVWRVMEEAERVARVFDALIASDGPPTRRAEPSADPAPAVTPKRHKTKRRASPLAAVLTMAEGKALNPNDWQSVWAALVALALPATRPAPLLGYVEGEGVQYRADDGKQPVAYLPRDAFRKRFGRKG